MPVRQSRNVSRKLIRTTEKYTKWLVPVKKKIGETLNIAVTCTENSQVEENPDSAVADIREKPIALGKTVEASLQMGSISCPHMGAGALIFKWMLYWLRKRPVSWTDPSHLASERKDNDTWR